MPVFVAFNFFQVISKPHNSTGILRMCHAELISNFNIGYNLKVWITFLRVKYKVDYGWFDILLSFLTDMVFCDP